MADKTSTQSLQPSTPFYATTPAAHSLTGRSNSISTYQSSSTPMAAIIQTPIRPSIMERKNPLDIQSLMSPPEQTPHDSFGRSSGESKNTKSMVAYPRVLPMSPPVSPAAKTIDHETAPVSGIRDPILYSDSQSPPSAHTPLFNVNEALETQRVVEGHIAARNKSLFREASPPQNAEYELALGFKFQVMKQFTANPRQWYNRERAQLLEDRARINGGRRYTNIAPASGLNIHRQARASYTSPKNGVVKQSRPPKPAAVKLPIDPNKVKAIREDKDYNSIRDICPPIDSLPKRHNSLKVEWRGAPINLDDDPDAHLLHEDEKLLAANLRLDCATYLTSKRRIFVSRLECLKRGKEFRKTDSQQACKIDVNKASKLWQAFEKVGWLNPQWMDKYL